MTSTIDTKKWKPVKMAKKTLKKGQSPRQTTKRRQYNKGKPKTMMGGIVKGIADANRKPAPKKKRAPIRQAGKKKKRTTKKK